MLFFALGVIVGILINLFSETVKYVYHTTELPKYLHKGKGAQIIDLNDPVDDLISEINNEKENG